MENSFEHLYKVKVSNITWSLTRMELVIDDSQLGQRWFAWGKGSLAVPSYPDSLLLEISFMKT